MNVWQVWQQAAGERNTRRIVGFVPGYGAFDIRRGVIHRLFGGTPTQISTARPATRDELAELDWAAAHGMVIRQMPDEEVWAIWERERVASFGTSTLACVAIEPIEGGTVHSLSGIPGN